MKLHFFHRNGNTQKEANYYAPGKFDYGPVVNIVDKFEHEEGDVVKFHVGHGSFREYLVEAKDADMALLKAV